MRALSVTFGLFMGLGVMATAQAKPAAPGASTAFPGTFKASAVQRGYAKFREVHGLVTNHGNGEMTVDIHETQRGSRTGSNGFQEPVQERTGQRGTVRMTLQPDGRYLGREEGHGTKKGGWVAELKPATRGQRAQLVMGFSRLEEYPASATHKGTRTINTGGTAHIDP